MSRVKEEAAAHPDALKNMMESPHNYDDTTWYSYRNMAMDSSNLGDRRFMAVGPKNTIKEPPNRYPDSHLGTGWAYLFEGVVDLETGDILEDDK